MASTSKKSSYRYPGIRSIFLTIHNNPTKDQIRKYFDEVIRTLRVDWKFVDIKYKLFKDGVTNQLIVFWNCKTDNEDLEKCKDALVLRINGKLTENYIDREQERSYWEMLSEKLNTSFFPTPFQNGVVYKYQPGKGLSLQQVRSGNARIQSPIIQQMKKFHGISNEDYRESFATERRKMYGNPATFWVAKCQEIMPKINLLTFLEMTDRTPLFYNNAFKLLKNIEMKHDLNNRSRLCHNDLLNQNIIINTNSKGSGENGTNDIKITFIDFDYLAFGQPAFDIANYFNEFAGTEFDENGTIDYEKFWPTKEFRQKFISEYLGYSSTSTSKTEIENIENFMHDVDILSLASLLVYALVCLYKSQLDGFEKDKSLDGKSLPGYDFLKYVKIRVECMVERGKRFGLHFDEQNLNKPITKY